MIIKTLGIILISFSLIGCMDRPKFRNGIFLTHSTGLAIWGPHGSTTSVPDEIVKYNVQHKFSSDSSFYIIRQDWPLNPWENEWARWHQIFDGEDTNADIGPFFNSYDFIIIKSCYPSSDLVDRGSSADTLNPTKKSIYNYKWHWRNIIKKMSLHPDNFFVIWTNAPRVAGATADNSALLSDSFCHWAKDTLAKGLDAEYGTFPVNVYVFDFFHKLAGTDGKLKLQYATDNTNSHPNSNATALVAPQLVNEVLDAATAYESKIAGIADKNNVTVRDYSLKQNYPNPFNPSSTINYSIAKEGNVKVTVFNSVGSIVATIINEYKPAGSYSVQFNGSDLASGIYLYRLESGNNSAAKKFILLK